MRITALALCVAAASALAQPGPASAQEALPPSVVMPEGRVGIYEVPRPVQDIILGDRDVADVTVINSRTVYIAARSGGNTTVAFLDASGQIIASTEVTITRETRPSTALVTVHKHAGNGHFVDEHVCALGTNLTCDPVPIRSEQVTEVETDEDEEEEEGEQGAAGFTQARAAAFGFENCAAARRAGAAPMRRGDPGYARRLDRDNDGLACERGER